MHTVISNEFLSLGHLQSPLETAAGMSSKTGAEQLVPIAGELRVIWEQAVACPLLYCAVVQHCYCHC